MAASAKTLKVSKELLLLLLLNYYLLNHCYSTTNQINRGVVVKMQKYNFYAFLTYNAGVCFISNGVKDTTLWQPFLSFYLFDSIFLQKRFHQKLESYRFKLTLKKLEGWIRARWNKMPEPWKCIPWEKECQR